MAVAVTGFAFEHSIENGGDAMKLGFVRAQQYKIADRLVTSNTETNPDGSRKVIHEKDDPWLVDCAVTGSSLGTPDDPKFPLKEYFRRTIFPIVDELVSPGGKYFGFWIHSNLSRRQCWSPRRGAVPYICEGVLCKQRMVLGAIGSTDATYECLGLVRISLHVTAALGYGKEAEGQACSI